MMAKMFYRFEEAKQVLGMSDEQLKQMTREGKLREFRDGTQVMYKADQVDALRSELGLGGDSVDLGPSDTGGPIGLADTKASTSSGSVISLADTTSKDDTATDMGLSSNTGSGTAISPSQSGSGTAIGLAGTNTGSAIGLANTGTASGISVLGLDEGGNADANAATAMGGSFGGEPSLEAMGSGSGLLDLSRERDDTSLGAPVLDEITGGSRSGSSMAPITGGSIGGATTAAARTGAMPVFVTESDNFSGFATGAAAAALIFVIPALYAVSAGAMRASPTLLNAVFGDAAVKKTVPFLYVVGAGLIAMIVIGLIGFIVGKKK